MTTLSQLFTKSEGGASFVAMRRDGAIPGAEGNAPSRPWRRWSVACSAFVMLAALGCQSSSRSLGSETPAEFERSLDIVSCLGSLHCDTGLSMDLDSSNVSDADCWNAAPPVPQALDAAIRAGTVVYDRAAAEECLASFAGDVCAGGRTAACDRVYVGTLAADAGCVHDAECVSGACEVTTPTSCGACLPPRGLGSPCGWWLDAKCEPGLYCDENYQCASGQPAYTPVVLVGEGDDCGEIVSDDVFVLCGSDLVCADYVCRPRFTLGQQCDEEGNDCEIGTTCREVGATDRCVAIRVATTRGEDCADVGGEYVVCDEEARLYCDHDVGRCESLAGSGDTDDECLTDGNCNSGFCVKAPYYTLGWCGETDLADGQACRADAQCLSGWCNSAFDGEPGFCGTSSMCQ